MQRKELCKRLPAHLGVGLGVRHCFVPRGKGMQLTIQHMLVAGRCAAAGHLVAAGVWLGGGAAEEVEEAVGVDRLLGGIRWAGCCLGKAVHDGLGGCGVGGKQQLSQLGLCRGRACRWQQLLLAAIAFG